MNLVAARRFLYGLCAILFLAMTPQASACPGCTYERLLNTNWHIKVFLLQVVCAVFVTANRLDAVRVLYIFIPLAVLNIKFQLLDLWYSHPAVSTAPEMARWYEALGLIGGLNLIGVAVLFIMGAIPFFRRRKDRKLALWQPAAYVFCLLVGSAMIRLH